MRRVSSRSILIASLFLSFGLISLTGVAQAGSQYCIPWEVKGWDKAKAAFEKAVASGAEAQAPYFYESVRLYLHFTEMECDENDSRGAADAVKMAITREREAGWLSASE